MVGCDVEDRRHLRLHGAHRFKLERADFSHRPAAIHTVERQTGIGDLDVADQQRVFVPFLENRIGQRGGRGFTVGAGNRDERTLVVAIGKLDLAPDGDALPGNSFEHIGKQRHARAGHADIDPVKVAVVQFTEQKPALAADPFTHGCRVEIGFAVV